MTNIAAIKTATQKAIEEAGGVDAVASAVRVGRSQISDYQNKHSPSVVPVDVALDLDRYAGEPLLLAEFAKQSGYAITPFTFGEGDIAAVMQRFIRRSGSTSETTVRILADGIVTLEEANDLLKDLLDVRHVNELAIQIVNAHIKNGGDHVPSDA